MAQELALRSRRLVRVLGRYALATDGYRTYFLEAGEYPQVIQVELSPKSFKTESPAQRTQGTRSFF